MWCFVYIHIFVVPENNWQLQLRKNKGMQYKPSNLRKASEIIDTFYVYIQKNYIYMHMIHQMITLIHVVYIHMELQLNTIICCKYIYIHINICSEIGKVSKGMFNYKSIPQVHSSSWTLPSRSLCFSFSSGDCFNLSEEQGHLPQQLPNLQL